MADTVQVRGLSELKAELDVLPRKLQNKAVRRSVAAAAKVVLTRAKERAPRRSGAIRRAIARRTRRIRNGRITQSIFVRTGRQRIGGQLKRGEDPFYWYMQEFGYRAVGRSPRKGRKKAGRRIPGRKFMSRSFDSAAEPAFFTFRSTLRKELGAYRAGRI